MKNNNWFLIVFNIILISILLFLFFMSKNIILLFVINFIICIEIIKKFKFSIFSFKSIVVNYILLPLLYQFLNGKSYGLLELQYVPIHYTVFLTSMILYNFTNFVYLLSKKVDEEQKKLSVDYKIKGKSIIFLCILAIICCFIAFPTMPFSYNSSTRFQALLPGRAWNHIVIICLIFLLGNLKTNKMVIFTYLFSIFWFLSHYERVDIIGLFAIIIFSNIFKNSIKLNYKKIIKYSLAIIIIFSLMSYIGAKRGGANINKSATNFFVQGTAADLAYVYNISIDYKEHNELLFGKTYIQYVVESIPLLSYKESVTNLLDYNYSHPGGEFILSAPLMNFGLFFIPVFAIIENYIIIKIIKSKRKYASIIYLFILASTFRINWYGIIYIETGLLFIIPILYFIYNKIFKSLVFLDNY